MWHVFSFFSFSSPVCWLVGAYCLRALESCVPKGICEGQQGQRKFELVSTQDPSGRHWPLSLVYGARLLTKDAGSFTRTFF